MPPYLHPRSAATSTLFAATLAASFIVVGIPHVFPCPQPRRINADSQRVLIEDEGVATDRNLTVDNSGSIKQQGAKMMRENGRTATVCKNMKTEENDKMDQATAVFLQLQREAAIVEKEAHECPVPKPTGWLGRVLGFDEKNQPVKKGAAP